MCGEQERKFGRVSALLLVLADILPSGAYAHPLDLALLALTPGEHNVWRVRLEVNPSVADALLGKGSMDEQVAIRPGREPSRILRRRASTDALGLQRPTDNPGWLMALACSGDWLAQERAP